MATISTDTYLDGGVARTAGEAWTINGATLTIRTDTRWHANAPASMTGTLSGITTSTGSGGTFAIDGTKVRWMAYDTGSGNVPAIGTTITQGGVSGYLLGVWADYTSAPTTVGAAMPASGYLKFREVTGGQYSVGALTGIGANASEADRAGWIEVVHDSGSIINMSALGDGFITTGDWFYLDSTNGTRGQQISTPTNGGGTNTNVYGVQIETAPGSGIFEWYFGAHQTLGGAIWTTANVYTDARAKLVESMGNGVIRIGSNGTVDIGYLPPAGCKVRIPNIICRTVLTASRATNQIPASVTKASFGSAVLNINISHIHADYNIAAITSSKYVILNSTFEGSLGVNDATGQMLIDNVAIGGFSYSSISFNRLTSGTFSNIKVLGNPNILGLTYSTSMLSNVYFYRVEFICGKARTGSIKCFAATSIDNCLFEECCFVGAVSSLVTSRACTFKNCDYIDRLEGPTTSLNSMGFLSLLGCNDITVDGFTFGLKGQLQNCNCTGALVSPNTYACDGIYVKNIGTRLNPINSGTLGISNITYSSANDKNIKVKRCFFTKVNSTPVNLTGTVTNIQGIHVEDVFGGNYTVGHTPWGYEATVRKCGFLINTSRLSSNLGVHWTDNFESDTTGSIKWFGCAPTVNTASKNFIVATPAQGTGYISTSATVSLDTSGDYFISESDWIKGHTGFRNSTPQGIAMNIQYDLDVGNGFSGTWKTLNLTNLLTETINPSGFKIKIKGYVTANSANTDQYFLDIKTTSTIQAQADNLYPLDPAALSFTGLIPGSEVRCYAGTDPATAIEIGGTEATGGSTFSFSHSSGGAAGTIVILAMGYQPIYLPYTFKTTDDSILIQPVIDRNYYNPL